MVTMPHEDFEQMLERAASATHQSVSAFVLQAASRQAETVLAERSSRKPGALRQTLTAMWERLRPRLKPKPGMAPRPSAMALAAAASPSLSRNSWERRFAC